MSRNLSIGVDVGSTTVKAVVVDPATDNLLWSRYQRHEGKQLARLLEILRAAEERLPEIDGPETRIFATGSGAGGLEQCLGAKFVQEVNAVALAVERYHPEVGSVVELGGQDAKIIIFRDDPATGGRTTLPTMNDKCAGGTGAVLDKVAAKLGLSPGQLAQQRYDGVQRHNVAGKCGVFAETDINSLQLLGIPTDQLMASLFEAIVGQNLSVLTRGHTLPPHVLLLGGPNTFIPGMAEAWKACIPPIWRERDVALPLGVDPASLIYVPENAHFFGALGAVAFGRDQAPEVGRYRGLAGLEREVQGSRGRTRAGALPGLGGSPGELQRFREEFRPVPFAPATFQSGSTVAAYLGIDGGSTSTKGVLLDEAGQVLVKSYRLSRGNPIEDTQDILARLREQVERQGARLEIRGFGVTGYARDILKDVFQADVAIVETVAHTTSALHLYRNVDVICDVGGQDIKIMILKDGQVRDFKLNTQCSAGNGYFLQSTAQGLGIPVEDYARVAFEADTMPRFGYGCAVFMQSDIVNFQRQGWTPSQLLAGLAAVLPMNIWLYVAQMPNLARLGSRFVLQGGTQRNLAAVKAQVDFIRSHFRGTGVDPEIVVHSHCGVSGAIGAAMEAIRVRGDAGDSSFLGLDEAASVTYATITDARTRCTFCRNRCLRTFIDVRHRGAIRTSGNGTGPDRKVPLVPGARRLIVGNACEKGSVEFADDMRTIRSQIRATTRATPNLVAEAAKTAFRSWGSGTVADPIPRISVTPARRRRARLAAARSDLRIGIPRVLGMYTLAPLFRTYFESLGVKPGNVVFSDFTSPSLYREGAKRGAIDPCFPSKVAIPHVHDLLHRKHAQDPLDLIFFPMVDDLPSEMRCAMGHRTCPTITTTAEATRAAFTKEGDVFARNGVRFLNPFLNAGQPALFQRQMYQAFRDVLGVSEPENRRAIAAGMEAYRAFRKGLRTQAAEALVELECEARVGIVVLGRPYHADHGINHDILGEFQRLGYPIFTPGSLPVDGEVVETLFGDEVRAGIISDPLDIGDVWKMSYSENSNWKLWAAKFTARHPNLVALELNSFRCGHDAPLFTVIEQIVEAAGTPFFSFRDLDENKPSGSIRIRVETIHHFLERYRQDLEARAGRHRRPIDSELGVIPPLNAQATR